MNNEKEKIKQYKQKQDEADFKFMKKALEEADKAYDLSEIPIGAVIVCNDKVVGKGYNLKENKKNTLLHAELIAINEASKKLNKWRLEDCTIYVNLEPCAMCAGAIINSRIKRVVFSCKDNKSGALGSVLNLNDFNLNHKVEIRAGVLEEESKKIIQKFFKELRDGKQKKF